jgi:lysophospholipid acyltransferase (LPLAT)-like uncharacterized protein
MSGWRRLAARLASPLYFGLAATWRVQVRLPDGEQVSLAAYPHGREIFAACERDLAALGAAARHAPFLALIANGTDGDWAETVLVATGGAAARGAHARRGGEGWRRLRAMAGGWPGPVVMVVDGPVGPAGVPRGGTGVLARATGRPVRPVAAAARVALRVPRTWSGLYVPAPWTTVCIACGPPMEPCPPDRAGRASWTQHLAEALRAARRAACEAASA